MKYGREFIAPEQIPLAQWPVFQHIVDTYASETNKTASVWSGFAAADLIFRPHPRSMTVEEAMRHQLLSERRFFAEFLGSPEPPAESVLGARLGIDAYIARLVDLAVPRLAWLAGRNEPQWLETADFFDVRRERIWIFWRRVLHSAHHRTQLAVYLRLLNKPLPAIYGPTADVTWSGADPTLAR
jgi:uncharacterized damage-inducible protein DinB